MQYSYSDIVEVSLPLTNKAVVIYPNPSTNVISIEGGQLREGQLKIYNYLGTEVSNQTSTLNHTNQKLSVEITNLKDGVYFIILNNKTVGSFIKNINK